MRVFISSVISGMETFREAAAQGVATLRHEPRMAEDYGASSDTPQQKCLAGVRDADIVVLLIGERYGQPQESGLSATHEEYREAKEEGRDVFAFIQEGVEREPDQQGLLREVQSWNSGVYTENFADSEGLRAGIIRMLHEHELTLAAGSADEEEMLSRALELVPNTHSFHGASLNVAVVGGPPRTVLSPSQLEDSQLGQILTQEALFGSMPIFDTACGTANRWEGGALVLEQDVASVLVNEQGSVRIVQPAMDRGARGSIWSLVLIEEEVNDRIERGLRFAGSVLDRIDPLRRLPDVVVIVSLHGAGTSGWRTKAEHQQNVSTGVQINVAASDPIVVRLSPARRRRAALANDATRMAKDFTVLLRREIQP